MITTTDPNFAPANLSYTPLNPLSGGSRDAVLTPPSGDFYFTIALLQTAPEGVAILPLVNKIAPQPGLCISQSKTYYYEASDFIRANKLFAVNWNGNTAPVGITGNIRYSATPYAYISNARNSDLMGRLVEINPAGGSFSINGGATVRLYYSPAEQAAGTVPAAQTTSWFKYQGTQDELLNDFNADGALATAKTTFLTPSATGQEDGVDYVEFSGIGSFSTFGFFTSSAPMPVDLVSFRATKTDERTVLKWSTAEESGFSHFELEALKGGYQWEEIASIPSATPDGNSRVLNNYKFTDESAQKRSINGKVYYRLKMIDQNASYRYSHIESIAFDDRADNVGVYPNPAKSEVNILGLHGKNELKIYNSGGRLVATTYNVNPVETIDLRKFIPGIYFIHIKKEGAANRCKKGSCQSITKQFHSN
jgi:hypothetical protein